MAIGQKLQDKAYFLAGVAAISFAVLLFQIVQTRILSVIAWYYLAFFGISMAMLGMTAGAVRVYLKREYFRSETLDTVLAGHSLACALSIPISLAVQLSLITTLTLSATTFFSWAFLTIAMAVPYYFAGVVVSLALTRSPFPVNQVYGVDLLGAALGCISVIFLLRILDGPSAMMAAGVAAAVASLLFYRCGQGPKDVKAPFWRKPAVWIGVLSAIVIANTISPAGLRPILVKDLLEKTGFKSFEEWNSFSRVIATQARNETPWLWGPSPNTPDDLKAQQVQLNIDGLAGTTMFQYTPKVSSLDFLRYDLVNLGYNLPHLGKAAVIGVGGGRDIMSAHLYGVQEIVGVELNPIFIDLHTQHDYYRNFSGLTKLPNLRLYVDDARSWFASTDERFDLIQMSMIDTWASTGAGAFSLSENGLYTLEGWRSFFSALNDNGYFTVSRWYSPDNVDETGRMISLAVATVLDTGLADARPHIFVANADRIATLVLAKRPFTEDEIALLRRETERLGFGVLMAPDQSPASTLLDAIVRSKTIDEVDEVTADTYLDLSVPTDNRPFFFNQLKISRIGDLIQQKKTRREGVMFGNLLASLTLLMILVISAIAVVTTILLPLRSAVRDSSRPLVVAGSVYFFLIGLGFMLAEISMLQYFSVYLGHPIYSLSVCLFSLILATGFGSLASEYLSIRRPVILLVWGLVTFGYLVFLASSLSGLFEATTERILAVRIMISIVVLGPLGFLLGFAFPTGIRLTNFIDATPAPWFWGINGATGVLASVLAIVISMNFGINVTVIIAALCYLLLVPVAWSLVDQGTKVTAVS